MTIREVLFWALEGIQSARKKYLHLQQLKRMPDTAGGLVAERLAVLARKEIYIRLLLKMLKGVDTDEQLEE